MQSFVVVQTERPPVLLRLIKQPAGQTLTHENNLAHLKGNYKTELYIRKVFCFSSGSLCERKRVERLSEQILPVSRCFAASPSRIHLTC